MFKKQKLKPVVGKRQLNRRVSKHVQSEICKLNSLVNETNISDIKNNGSCVLSNFEEINFEQHDTVQHDIVQHDIIQYDINVFSKVVERNTYTEPSNVNLQERLRNWVITEKVSHSSVTGLLHILHDFHSLPLDCRALLKTPRQIRTKQVGRGEYIHFKLENILKDILNSIVPMNVSNLISLSFNVDGLPLFHSTNLQFWPILCLIKNFKIDPFAVGIYCGSSKPDPIALFLEDLINELVVLLENGITHNDVQYQIKIHSFICDAPARAYLKCTKSHGGYSSCDKCEEYGNYINGRVILNHNPYAKKRTNQSFLLQTDDAHHTNTSPLTSLNIDMVTHFPIDYMHCVCLGVMRKLLNTWVGGKLQVRLQARQVTVLSQQLESLKEHFPVEINRKPRSLSELARWKATEFRSFLLYLGPFILKRNVSLAVYEHFLLLHCGILILVSSKFIEKFGTDMASEILNVFVSHCKHIYGLEFYVYNVHILSHLADDANYYGTLDSFSAFPFENFLGQIKRYIKNSNKPLHQIYNRLTESSVAAKMCTSASSTRFMYQHISNDYILELDENFKQYKKIIFNNFMLTTDSYSNANCFCLVNKVVVKIYNILTNGKEEFIIGREFCNYSSLYSYPIDSKNFDIYIVKDLSHLKKWKIEDISAKCMVLPHKNAFVSFPLIHTV